MAVIYPCIYTSLPTLLRVNLLRWDVKAAPSTAMTPSRNNPLVALAVCEGCAVRTQTRHVAVMLTSSNPCNRDYRDLDIGRFQIVPEARILAGVNTESR